MIARPSFQLSTNRYHVPLIEHEPEAAVSKKFLPSLTKTTEEPTTSGSVSALPLVFGVAPGIPAKTSVPPDSCEPVRT